MFFEGFFFLLFKQMLDYWVFIKEMFSWRGSLWLFTSNCEQGKFMQIEAKKKNILVLRQWTELY